MTVVLWLVAALAAILIVLALVTRLLVRRGRRRAPQQGSEVVVDSVRLNYVDLGEGRPVVYLHGSGGSLNDIVFSLGPRLAERYRLLAFDRPGFGHSDRLPDRTGDPTLQAELISGALERLGVERPLLVAHSAGAPVAAALAIAHPGDVSGIVLLSGYLFSARDPDRVLGRLLTLPVVGWLLRETIVIPLGTLLAPLAVNRLFFPAPADPAYAGVATALALRPRRYATNAHDIADLELGMRTLAGRYAELSPPIVAVHGLADYVVSAANPVRLRQLAPQTELVLLEEIGHLPQFTAPEAVLDAVERAWDLAGQRASLGHGG